MRYFNRRTSPWALSLTHTVPFAHLCYIHLNSCCRHLHVDTETKFSNEKKPANISFVRYYNSRTSLWAVSLRHISTWASTYHVLTIFFGRANKSPRNQHRFCSFQFPKIDQVSQSTMQKTVRRMMNHGRKYYGLCTHSPSMSGFGFWVFATFWRERIV